jgi:hypothetical protein
MQAARGKSLAPRFVAGTVMKKQAGEKAAAT